MDVNSGSATKEKGIEETAFRVNMEAAPEIARQLRLRDLGGIIVIDFIDMIHKNHKQEVERALKTVLKDDRAKTKVLRISLLGLLELSRQRLKSSWARASISTVRFVMAAGKIRSPKHPLFRFSEGSSLCSSNRMCPRSGQPSPPRWPNTPESHATTARGARKPVFSEGQYPRPQSMPDKDVIVEAVKEESAEQPLQLLQPVLEAMPILSPLLKLPQLLKKRLPVKRMLLRHESPDAAVAEASANLPPRQRLKRKWL